MAVVGLEEKYDAVKQLIAIGKERGYLLYDEVNELLAEEFPSGREFEDLLTDLDTAGVSERQIHPTVFVEIEGNDSYRGRKIFFFEIDGLERGEFSFARIKVDCGAFAAAGNAPTNTETAPGRGALGLRSVKDGQRGPALNRILT